MKVIVDKLKKLQDKKYAEFQSKLIPTVDKKAIIGVRTPELKKFAKELISVNLPANKRGKISIKSDKYFDKTIASFLDELPHKYFDENQLHTFILSEIKDFDICIELVDKFLPYIDNWATCDQLSPKCFKKNKEKLLKYINKWINSKKPYIIRFAIEMLMSHFLDADFDKKYLKMVSDVRFIGKQKSLTKNGSKHLHSTQSNDKCSKENISIDIDSDKYYVEMMRAWYFATALAKQYEATLTFIKNRRLNVWTHNKIIQKALESFRVSEKHKKELRAEKII